MQELMFLLVLMVMTGLGVRMLLMQLDGRGPRLPRASLPKLSRITLSVPKLPRRGRRRPRRSRTASTPAAPSVYTPIYDEENDDDFDQFAPSHSPYGLAAIPAPAYLEGVDEDVEEDDDLVPVNQVDFFSDEPEVIRRPAVQTIPTHYSIEGAEHEVPGEPVHAVEGQVDLTPEDPAGASSQVEAPALEREVEIPTDPNDILSFFEKPAALTQLPETLREAVEQVSAAELLAEARQISQMIRGRQQSA